MTEENQEDAVQNDTAKDITNIGQAINVLVQGVDMGRKAGIYSWEDTVLIAQSLQLLKIPTEVSNKDTSTSPDIASEE